MTLPLRFSFGFTWQAAVAALLLSGLQPEAHGQNCPAASSCNPTLSTAFAGNVAFGMGISNVTLNTLNNTTPLNSAGGTQNGYQSYACTGTAVNKGTTLNVGQAYTITVTTNPNANENVRVYIDLNNDNTLNATTELVFSSNDAKIHTGTITLPTTTVQNVALRMRVVSEFTGATGLPTPCRALEFGQAEDYYVIGVTSTSPPVAAFTTTETLTCDGTVCFTDLSQNNPTSWSWTFQGGTPATSTAQNPCVTYSAAGTFNVSLTVTNAQGTNTVTKTGYVTYNNNVPVAASCTPSTLSYCCNYGIYRVTLGAIDNPSADGSAGYQDFTCQQAATLTSGLSYPLTIQTSPSNNQDTYVWIDYDNNGTFSNAELVFSALNTKNPSTNLTPPATAVTNVPLRMRVSSDFGGGNVIGPCSNLTNGQAEDYTVTIRPNTGIPVVNFNVSNFSVCSPTVQFVNQTQNTQPNITYLWSFGDNTTSTAASPLHTYPNVAGTYTVKLKACNGTRCDSLTRTNFLTIDPTLPVCDTIEIPATSTLTATTCTGVLLDDGGVNGQYANSSDGSVTISPPGAASVSLTFQSFDYENPFDRIIIYNGPTTSSPVIGTYSGNLLPNGGTVTSTTGSITIRQVTDNFIQRAGFVANWSCNIPNTPPVTNFSAQLGNICTGSVPFQDQSSNGPTSWTWDFGDGTTSNQQNPTHTYATATAASYTVTLTACNALGCSTTVKPNFINITVPCLNYCTSSGHNNNTNWISNVQFGTINNTTGPETNGYGDYTSQNASVQIGTAVPLTVRLAAQTLRTISIWIDINRNGTFEATELLYSQNSGNITGGFGVTGNITIPTTAQLGSTRMRIFARQSPNGNTDPCFMNSQAGEVEDYSVTITGNNQPPVADFIANPATVFAGNPVITCTGTVTFTDRSSNGPTSWAWNFGDPGSGASNTSTQQNPTHTFSAPGLYNVQLVATNAQGNNTVLKTGFVRYNPNYALCDSVVIPGPGGSLPTLTTCTGSIYDSGGPNGNYLNGNASSVTISPAGATNVVLNFTQFSYDNNFDFLFIYDGPNASSPLIGQFTGNNLPQGGTITSTGPSITLREVTSQQNNQAGFAATWACIQANQPPVPLFTSNQSQICTGLVTFTDQSAGAPTSWSWDFGDGNTSTVRNPSHTYSTAAPGTYTVTLTACNANGCATLAKPNYVTVSVPCYCTSSGHINTTQWISNVTLGSVLNQSSAAEPGGYGNYTNPAVPVVQGATYPLNVTLGQFGNRSLAVWIDFNQNGTFEAAEKVFSSANFGTVFNGSITIPGTAMLGVTRMRVFMRNTQNNNDPCASGLQGSEVEDYALNIQTNNQQPLPAFSAMQPFTCTGMVNFLDQSQFLPTSYFWTFGDGGTSTQPSPTYMYTNPGTYTVKLKVCNAFGCDSLEKVNFVRFANTATAVAASCTPATTNFTCCFGISQVSFNRLQNTSGNASAGYEDFTCGMSDTVVAGKKYLLRVLNSSAQPENLRAYIDFNSNGSFADPGEQVLLSNNNTVHADSILIPLTAVRKTYLRLRIMSDRTGTPFPNNACSNLFTGQAEDYTLYISDPVGRNEAELAAAITLYPNPSTGLVQLTLPAAKAARIKVENVLGATVLQQTQPAGAATATLDLSRAAKGLYLVKVTVDQTTLVKKVVIE